MRFSVAKSKPALPPVPERGIATLASALPEKGLIKIASTLEKVLSGQITDREMAVNNIFAQIGPVLNRYTVPEFLQDYFKYGTTGEDFASALLAKLLEGKQTRKYFKEWIPADREKALFLLTRAFSAVAETQEQNTLSEEVVSWRDPDGINFEGQFVRELGQGGFGKVLKYTVDKNLSVAVKQPLMDPDQLEYAEFVRSLKKQMSELKTQTLAGGHDNVVELYCVIKQPNGPIAMVMEEVPNGELLGIMAPSKDHPTTTMLHQLSEQAPERAQNALLCILKDIFAGLSHIHGRGVAHHDFKPENIFIGQDGTLKVADFGEATTLKVMSVFSSDVEQHRYLAPEVVLQRKLAEEQWQQLAQHSTWKEADEKLSAEVTMLNAQRRELPETETKEIDQRLAKIRTERSKLASEYKKAEKEAKNRVSNESKKAQENIAASLESIAPEKVERVVEKYLQEGSYLFHPQHADKWSVGVSIYYTLFGIPPFDAPRDSEVEKQLLDFRKLSASQRRQFLRLDDITDEAVIKLAEEFKVPLTKIRMPMWLDDKVKDALVELMFELLNPDPMQRPDLNTVLENLIFYVDEGAELQAREDILTMAHSGKSQ